jgi:hypothetical protein
VVPFAAAAARAAKYPEGTVMVITPPAAMPLGGTKTTLMLIDIIFPPIMSIVFNLSDCCTKT